MHHCAARALSLIFRDVDLKEPPLLNHVTFSDVHLGVYRKTDGIWAHTTQVESASLCHLFCYMDQTHLFFDCTYIQWMNSCMWIFWNTIKVEVLSSSPKIFFSGVIL
jgi:hypothetical protein